MLGLSHLSIKSKLQITILIASLGSVLVVGYLSWSKARGILTERIFSQLTSVRVSKAYQLEAYFNTLRYQIETLCENQMVADAMTGFNREFDLLKQVSIPQAWDRELDRYYNQEFLPRLAKNSEGTPVFETYRPTSPEARYLQYHYLAKNPYPVGKKDELGLAKGEENYHQVHRQYHNFFRNLIKRLGYYDLFLIDAETGDIVYSVYKETDFSSNLFTGPYRNSNLAKAVRLIRDNPDRGATQLVDFQFYRPSYNSPAAFIASSIYNGPRRVGILAVQLPIDEINQVLTGKQNWKQEGLGETGETYVVGEDLRLRSAARLLIENPTAYLDTLRQNRVKPATIHLIEQLKTSLLLDAVETEATRQSIQGRSGIQTIRGSRGVEVLSSYAPLDIPGVNWGIVSEMALSEAYAPIYRLQNYLLLSSIILMAIVTVFATIVAQRFMRPLDAILQRYGYGRATPQWETESGEAIPELERYSQNELKELAQIFQKMAQQIRQKAEVILHKEQENERLLLNILPRPVMERWRQGEIRIVDRVQQVTVIAIQIVGLEKATHLQNDRTVAEGLNQLVTLLDEKGDKTDVERLNCFGDRYLAACGLTKTRLDHVKRGVDFGQDALTLVKEVNQRYNLSLSLRIGIHTGSVTAALIGERKFRYDLWGDPVSLACQLAQQAEANTIRVTQAVCDRVQDLFPFESDKSIVLEDKRTLPTWVLGKTGMRELLNELTFGLRFDDDETPPVSSTEENSL